MSLRLPRRLLPVLAVAVAACGSGGASPSAAAATELEVHAAASLAKVLGAVEAAYAEAVPGVRLTVSTDSSAALATKIEQGAPADVFLSADMANAQRLLDGGLATGSVVAFAGNRLTLIVPADNPAAITGPADLARPGVRILATADGVPIQAYTARVVANLAALDGYPAGFANAYAANVVSREDNVSAIVTKVALGEGDAGVVYDTDAAGSDDVATLEIPAEASVAATYGGVVIGSSSEAEAARAFLHWLAGPDGQAVLAGFGFLPPG